MATPQRSRWIRSDREVDTFGVPRAAAIVRRPVAATCTGTFGEYCRAASGSMACRWTAAPPRAQERFKQSSRPGTHDREPVTRSDSARSLPRQTERRSTVALGLQRSAARALSATSRVTSSSRPARAASAWSQRRRARARPRCGGEVLAVPPGAGRPPLLGTARELRDPPRERESVKPRLQLRRHPPVGILCSARASRIFVSRVVGRPARGEGRPLARS